MPKVEVEIDLECLETSDLIDELMWRLESATRILPKQRSLLIEDLFGAIGLDFPVGLDSLDDQIKFEHIAKVFSQYTTTEIETLLPIK